MKGNNYALVFNGKIAAKGSKREMTALRKRKASTFPGIFLAFTMKAVGDSWGSKPTGFEGLRNR